MMLTEYNLTLPAWYTVELRDSICHRLHHNLAALVPEERNTKH